MNFTQMGVFGPIKLTTASYHLCQNHGQETAGICTNFRISCWTME